MIYKAIKSWFLFEKELRSVYKGMKKAKVKNQVRYYKPVFDKEGFHHWMKKGKRQ